MHLYLKLGDYCRKIFDRQQSAGYHSVYMNSFICILSIMGMVFTAEAAPKVDYKRLRAEMVEKQIRARGVKDKAVLEAMMKVPRHKFVLPRYIGRAYGDHPLPIGEGQTISQPYIVAVMTELLGIKEGDKVLEIGTGSGYTSRSNFPSF